MTNVQVTNLFLLSLWYRYLYLDPQHNLDQGKIISIHRDTHPGKEEERDSLYELHVRYVSQPPFSDLFFKNSFNLWQTEYLNLSPIFAVWFIVWLIANFI